MCRANFLLEFKLDFYNLIDHMLRPARHTPTFIKVLLIIEMKFLFRGYVTRDWFGTNFASDKYKECNKIIVKLCVKYYEAYWKNRNAALHNEVIQRNRIIEWYHNERRRALCSNYPQVKAFAMARTIVTERASTKSIIGKI